MDVVSPVGALRTSSRGMAGAALTTELLGSGSSPWGEIPPKQVLRKHRNGRYRSKVGSEAPVLCASSHTLPLQAERQPQDPIVKAGSSLTPIRARWGGGYALIP